LQANEHTKLDEQIARFFVMKKLKKLTPRQISTTIVLVCFIFTIAVIGQTMMVINESNLEQQIFLEGIKIEQINVSGLNKIEATRQLGASINQKINEMNLIVTYQDREWKFKGSDFSVQQDVKMVVEDAYQYQQKLLHKDKNFNANTIVTKGLNIDVAFEFLFQDLNDKVEAIIKEVEKAPVNSRVSFFPEKDVKFEFSKSYSGLKVDRVKLLKDIEYQFKNNHNNMQVTLQTVKIEPQVTESYLQDKTKLISTFSTDLHNSKERRIQNVQLALSKINGLTIKPNEEISFNSLTGPQTLEGGYQKSIIIFNGQFVEGVGGGLCQASTTLYNALILANMEILEVKKHTLPVGYIELAFDAMVSENWSDLRFKNPSQNNVYLVAYVKDERAYVEVYGKTLETGVKIKRKSEFVKTIGHPGDKIVFDVKGEFADKVLYKGERYRVAYPREGYEARAYLQFYSGGNLIKEVLIRDEIYEPQHGIIIEGASVPPKDYVIAKSDVEFIPPQDETSNTTGSNVSAVILKTNPPDYNP
jgi:vancomycin resistance protein YoaR